MKEDYHWQHLRRVNMETLADFKGAGLLVPQEDSVYQRIVNEWLFPLHSVATEDAKRRYRDLRARQTQLEEEFWGSVC